MDKEQFCPICIVEGQDQCEEHCEPDEDEDFQRELDSWHDIWESHEFGCK